jgi:hypothetical protein
MGLFKSVGKIFKVAAFAAAGAALAYFTGGSSLAIGLGALGGALTGISRMQQKKAAARAKAQAEEMQRLAAAILLNHESNDAPLPVPYGLRRMGGITCLKETTGSENKYLHKVVALGEGPISDVVNVYLDNVLLTDSRFTDIATVESYRGEPDQAASAALVAALPGKWTTLHQGKGVAYLYGKFKWHDSKWQGEPVVTANVKGRLLYDPRDDATRFSNNPALAIRDYLTNSLYGRGIDESAIDDASFSTAADFCDERLAAPAHTETLTVTAASDTVTFPAATIFWLGDGVQFATTAPDGLSAATTYYYIPLTETTGQLASSYANALAGVALDITGTAGTSYTISHVDQARHQLDGVLDVSQTPLENVEDMLGACRGYLVYTGGVYKLKCDKADSSSGFAFNEDNIIGAWRIQMSSRRERFNRVSAVFCNPSRQWQTDVALFDSTTYRTADNGLVLEKTITLPFTASYYRALRHAQIECRQSRLGIQCQFRSTVEALRCEVGDVVEITHSTPGWTSKLFRIDSLELRPDDEVDVFASEYDAGAYTLDPLSEVRTAPVTGLADPFDVAEPGTPSVAETLYQTTGSAGVKARATVSWMAAPDAFVSHYQLEFKAAADSEYVVLPVTTGLQIVLDDLTPGIYNFRVKAFNVTGISSDYSVVTTHELYGLTAAPADITGFSVTKVGGLALATWTLPADLDVQINGSVVIRHANQTSAASWNDGVVMKEFPGSLVTGFLDLVTGTYLAKALDSSGNYSENAVSFVITEGMASGFTTVTTVTENPTFSGAKTNTAGPLPGIQLDGATLIDSMATSIDDWPYIDSLGGIQATGSYAFASTLDLTTVATRRFESDIQAASFDTGDLIDSRTDLIDDWGSFDGVVIDDCTVTLWARITDDNPAGSPTWSAWMPYRVADFTCRAIQHKLEFASGSAQHNINVSVLKVDVKTPVSP